VVLAATDPAQPYGAALAWPPTADEAPRPARAAGALVVLRAGEPLAALDRGGHQVVTFPAAADDPSWAEALAGLVKDGRLRSLELRRVDAQRAAQSRWADALRAAGFLDGYRGLVLRP